MSLNYNLICPTLPWLCSNRVQPVEGIGTLDGWKLAGHSPFLTHNTLSIWIDLSLFIKAKYYPRQTAPVESFLSGLDFIHLLFWSNKRNMCCSNITGTSEVSINSVSSLNKLVFHFLKWLMPLKECWCGSWTCGRKESVVVNSISSLRCYVLEEVLPSRPNAAPCSQNK